MGVLSFMISFPYEDKLKKKNKRVVQKLAEKQYRNPNSFNNFV